MTGCENCHRAIEFKGPAYLPCTISADLNWLNERDEAKPEWIRELDAQLPDDMLSRLDSARTLAETVTQDSVKGWMDEWQTGWADDGHGANTESYPLSRGYDELVGHTFPAPLLEGRFAATDDELSGRGDRYARAVVWFTLLERLWMLRGFENMMMDPYVNEHDLCRLRDRVVEHNLAIIDQWLERPVDAVFFSDDWGSQRGLLKNPNDWRWFYKPSYERMFGSVRSGGAHVWMHLCGNVTAILPDLIDIGLNVLNPVQPQAMDVRPLSRGFGGKVCFNGGVLYDLQDDPEELDNLWEHPTAQGSRWS